MARGWESKSVEAQQEAARERTASPPVPAAEKARSAERETLRLARQKILADLQHACAAAHRAMLERALVDLDTRIAHLDEAART